MCLIHTYRRVTAGVGVSQEAAQMLPNGERQPRGYRMAQASLVTASWVAFLIYFGSVWILVGTFQHVRPECAWFG